MRQWKSVIWCRTGTSGSLSLYEASLIPPLCFLPVLLTVHTSSLCVQGAL
jgi:hypothetical protein